MDRMQRAIDWCRQHDWGRTAYALDDRTVGGLVSVAVGQSGHVYRMKVDVHLDHLRAWAGY